MNRRKLLGSLGLIGGSAALGGIATQAAFNDQESAATTVTAGELDIKLDWKAFHNGDQIALQGPTDADGVVAASFNDVKPGDEGCFSLSIHNDTNPAYVWLAMDITDETDGDNDPSDDPVDEPDPQECPPTTYPWICGQKETDGDVTITNDGSNLIIEITSSSGHTLEETHVHITDVVDSIPGGPSPGQFDYSHENVNADTDRYEIPFDNAEYPLACGNSPIIAVHAAEDSGETCWAGSTEVNPGKGGNWALAIDHTIDCCPTDETDGETTQPFENHSLADKILLDAFWDDDADCVIDEGENVLFENITLRSLANNIEKSTGGIMPKWYVDGTQYFSLAWNLPYSVGNEIQGDTLTVSFHVYAVQRRHNEDPTNPWI